MATFLTKYHHKREFKAAMKSAERMDVYFVSMFDRVQSGTLREFMARGLTEWTVTNSNRKWFASVTIKQDGYRGLKAVVE